MTDSFTPRRAKNNYDRYPSPSIVDNDRYTPPPSPPPLANSNRKKPETYHLGTKNNKNPIDDDEPPFRSSSPPIKNSYPSNSNGPELYHLKTVENNNEIHDRQSPSVFDNNNRVSPMPLQNPSERKSEMYYLKTTDENVRHSSPIKNNYEKTKLNDNIMNFDNQNPQKVTVYVLKATNQENLSLSPVQRSPSPSLLLTKRSEPVSYDTISNHDRVDAPNKRYQYPTALNTISTNVRYVPLSQSKASESIQRKRITLTVRDGTDGSFKIDSSVNSYNRF
ncbi:unnamed protein product [Rotaria sp. Silwood1]|nr:unnamed protein product [Rotaria sp. Silwood1]